MSRLHRFESLVMQSAPLLTFIPEQQSRRIYRPHRFERFIRQDIFPSYTLQFDGFIRISETLSKVKGVFQYTGPNTRQATERAVVNFLNDIRGYAGVDYQLTPDTIIELTIAGEIPRPLLIQRNRMREHKPISVVNLYTNIIDIKSEHGMCVPDALTKKFPKIAKLKKSPIQHMKEANTDEVMEFCKQYNIRAIAYDVHKNVIAEHIPIHDDKKYASLVYLYYANHMYLIENKYLAEKPKPTKTVLQDSKTLESHFRSLIQQHILPANIVSDGKNVSSFSHDDVTYFANEDYEIVQDIGKQFMFSDKMPYFARLPYVLSTLEHLYSSTSTQSFLPIRHVKPAFFYNLNPVSDDHTTIDKNKAYSYILKNLPYLLSTDIRTFDCIKTSEFDDEHALYVAEAYQPNILMPKRDIYSGQHIKFCSRHIKFTIYEKLKCKKHTNHFTPLITDLFQKLPERTAKKVVVQAIGTFQTETAVKTVWNIVSKDDRNPNNFSIPYEDLYLEKSKSNNISHLYNRKPIAIQVKDRMNQMLYEKMLELKLTDKDIIQINTDSITFYNKPIHLILNEHDFDGWKIGTYEYRNCSIYDSAEPFDSFFQTINNNNTIITGPAGNGKSYYIQHMDLTDAIILSSKHSAIRQHKEKGLNAHVIQKFCGVSENMPTTIPKENHIIIEECGILTRLHWDFIFKCVLLNKKLTVLGDFNQLLPVDESKPYNQPLFLNMIFNTQLEKNQNYRNHFTLDYYKSLQTGSKEYLEQELKKHSTKTPEEADVIVAYTNNTVEKYNDYMLNYHNKTIDDDDVPMMCIINDPKLQEKNIFNNFLFKSQEVTFNPKQFKVAYARTLYNLQGDEAGSYYMAPEDIKWFLNPRMAYTLISRIKSLHNS